MSFLHVVRIDFIYVDFHVKVMLYLSWIFHVAIKKFQLKKLTFKQVVVDVNKTIEFRTHPTTIRTLIVPIFWSFQKNC